MSYYTTREAAGILKVMESTVREWIRAGKLGASYLSGNKVLRVSDEDIQAFYNRNKSSKCKQKRGITANV